MKSVAVLSNRKQLCAVIRKVKKDLMLGSTPLSDFATLVQQFCNNLVELFEVIHFFYSDEQPELNLENDYPNKTGHNFYL